MNKIFDTHVANKSKGVPQKGVKKPQHNFSVLPLPFFKASKKLFSKYARHRHSEKCKTKL